MAEIKIPLPTNEQLKLVNFSGGVLKFERVFVKHYVRLSNEFGTLDVPTGTKQVLIINENVPIRYTLDLQNPNYSYFRDYGNILLPNEILTLNNAIQIRNFRAIVDIENYKNLLSNYQATFSLKTSINEADLNGINIKKVNASISVTKDESWTGDTSMKVIQTVGGPNNGLVLDGVDNLQPGNKYTFSCYVKTKSEYVGKKIRLQIRETDTVTLSMQQHFSSEITLSEDWQRLVGTVNCGENGVVDKFLIQHPDAITGDVQFFVDGCQLEEGSLDTSWGIGNASLSITYLGE